MALLCADDNLDLELLLDDLCEVEDFASVTNSDESQSCNGKRKRHRKRVPWVHPAHLGPRVVRNDIRRSYANMYMNVLNSGDYHLAYGMLDTFFCPTGRQVFKMTINGEQHQTSITTGIREAAQTWFSTIMMVPDIAMELTGVSIQYATGRIVGNMKFSATQFYDDNISLSECNDSISRDVLESPNACSMDEGDPSGAVDVILHSVNKVVSTLQRRERPRSIEAVGTFVMYTDDQKRIIATDMEWFADVVQQ